MSPLQKPRYLNTESVCVNGQWSSEQMWKNIKGKSKSTKILSTPPSPTLSAPFPIPYLHSLKFEIKQPYFIGHLTFMSQWRVYESFTVAQTGFPAPAPWPHVTQQQPVRHPASPRALPWLVWQLVLGCGGKWRLPSSPDLLSKPNSFSVCAWRKGLTLPIPMGQQQAAPRPPLPLLGTSQVFCRLEKDGQFVARSQVLKYHGSVQGETGRGNPLVAAGLS